MPILAKAVPPIIHLIPFILILNIGWVVFLVRSLFSEWFEAHERGRQISYFYVLAPTLIGGYILLSLALIFIYFSYQ